MTNSIYVTRPFTPPLSEFIPLLEQIWDSGVLTNNGPLHRELESALERHLGIHKISLFNNGTIALITALQALRITGEVITTPYSFVATAHSLIWNGIRPVFVDIEAGSYGINPEKIEAAITPHTTAILAVHCYGIPCATESIQRIADNYNLRVIYDAAHAFGVSDGGGSVLRHGDLSVLSFHATKVFNTFEGGAIVSGSAKRKQHIDSLKNFGIADEVTVTAPGINGKMSEINAAFGLLQLRYIADAIAQRRRIAEAYNAAFADLQGILTLPVDNPDHHNYSYYPVRIVAGRALRDRIYEQGRKAGIYTRRYFYPLISSFPMYRGLPSAAPANLPVATRMADEVLCLPIYPGLSEDDVNRVCELVIREAKS